VGKKITRIDLLVVEKRRFVNTVVKQLEKMHFMLWKRFLVSLILAYVNKQNLQVHRI